MHLKTNAMRLILSLLIYALATAGLNSIGLPWIYSIVISCVVIGSYIGLWYKELAMMEQNYQKSIMHEDRIPVIGARPIDWDEYRDIPKLDINSPLTFDRNKIGYLYEPNKPLT